MRTTAVAQRLGPDRTRSASLVLGAVAGCAVLALVDPSTPGRYPSCPTQALLGLDCPACGTLRGLHSLTRGRIVQALDHNILLVVAVPLALWTWATLAGRALGRPVQLPAIPSWVLPAAVVVGVAYTVLRNIGPAGLGWLDSSA